MLCYGVTFCALCSIKCSLQTATPLCVTLRLLYSKILHFWCHYILLHRQVLHCVCAITLCCTETYCTLCAIGLYSKDRYSVLWKNYILLLKHSATRTITFTRNSRARNFHRRAWEFINSSVTSCATKCTQAITGYKLQLHIYTFLVTHKKSCVYTTLC